MNLETPKHSRNIRVIGIIGKYLNAKYLLNINFIFDEVSLSTLQLRLEMLRAANNQPMLLFVYLVR